MANFHDFQAVTIDGETKKLAEYKGRVCLVVNVASRCGLTRQYGPLEQLHRELSGRGLSVLGFPANEFGAQEPGTNEQIKEFCKSNYSVQFDMFGKVVVKGAEIHPLFAFLTEKSPFPGPIAWNFNKFLIGRDGEVIARFEPMVEPDSAELRAAIDKALG